MAAKVAAILRTDIHTGVDAEDAKVLDFLAKNVDFFLLNPMG